MTFRMGLVGLCTSHPNAWTPIMQKFKQDGIFDIEITAAWDSGETRPAGFAKEFCKQFGIPNAVDNMLDMMPMVDGVIVHTTNWDRHIEQARPFVEAGKSVMIDKPVAGNLRDINTMLDWMKSGKRVAGGSSLRFCKEVLDFVAQPESERGRILSATASCGVDEFNYGIHAYAQMCALMGPGARSARYIASAGNQKVIELEWADGRVGVLTVGKNVWLPFLMTVITDRKSVQIANDNTVIYRNMLLAELPFITGRTDEPPLPIASFAEPELLAIAARQSWLNNGAKVFLTDLRTDDAGYDGTAFAVEYRRARIQAEAKK